MIKTAADLSPAEIEKYARGARERAQASREHLEARRLRAWEIARKAASLLKEQFKARRVVLFGSLTQGPDRFYIRSDIDLAAWGLDERLYVRALGQLMDLDPALEVDLVEAEFARPEILKAIERDGIEL